MLPRWAMNSATRSAWTSSNSRNGSELRIVEDLGPRRRASLVERCADNLVGEDVEGEAMDVHEDERGAALIERIVNRGETGRRLRGDVEVSCGLEILVDRARPLDAVLVLFLEGSHQDFERLLTAEEGRDGTRMADGRG